MKKEIRWKKWLNAAFLLFVFALTFYLVFRGEDFGQVLEYVSQADTACVAAGIACVVAFILGEATVIHYLLRVLGTRVRFLRCCLYSFIGFFYSCITPSASGGQPMQVIAMRKDKIPVAVSTVVLAIVTITYKLVLVLIGTFIVIVRPEGVMRYLKDVMPVMYIGMGLNIGCVALLILLVFDPNLIRVLAEKTVNFLRRFRLFKRLKHSSGKLEKMIDQYRGAAEFYKNNSHVMIHVLLITFAQRVILFLVAWFTYRAFSLSGHGVALITSLQAMISVAADMLPLPGGMGVSETLFLQIFDPIFGEELILPGMMLSRGIGYYTQLLLSAVMTLAASFIITNDKKGEAIR